MPQAKLVFDKRLRSGCCSKQGPQVPTIKTLSNKVTLEVEKGTHNFQTPSCVEELPHFRALRGVDQHDVVRTLARAATRRTQMVEASGWYMGYTR